MNRTGTMSGILWMVLTGLLFVGVTASVKHGVQGLPAAEAAFLRYAIGLVFILPILGRLRAARFPPGTLGLFALRGGFHTFGVILWFFAMTRIPLTEVTAMNYLSPIYITIMASLFLGERFVPARGVAIATAFAGTLLILRPGFREVSEGHVAMLFTAMAFAGSYLVAKTLSARASPAVIVVMLSLTATIGLTPFALAVWQPPTASELLWLTVTAGLATGAHYTMTLAFRAAPISATQPVTFLQLIWAALLGTLLFGEPVDAASVAGGALIAMAVVALAFSEARGRRRRERTALGHE